MQHQITDNESSRALISDYSSMKEDDVVSGFWVEPGFRLELCRNIRVYPVISYGRVQYAWAEKKLERHVADMFATVQRTEAGNIDAGVQVAIVELNPKMGFFKRFSPSFDDYPSIMIELVIMEESSKKILCKVCHVGKDEKDFNKALDRLVKDLELFFKKKMMLQTTESS